MFGPARQNTSSQADSILQYKSPLTSTMASQGSAGSKTSTASSMGSSSTKEGNLNGNFGGGNNMLKIPVISEANDKETNLPEKPKRFPNEWLHNIDLDSEFPDIEDPKLLGQLQFVSPKTGVFRPVVESSSVSNSIRKSMSLGRGVKLKKNNACSIM